MSEQSDTGELFEFMDELLNASKHELEDTGGVAVVTYVRPLEEGGFNKQFGHKNKTGKKPMALIPYSENGSRDEWYAMIGKFVERFGAEFSVMVAESWYVESNQEEFESNPDMQPSKHADRKECIMVIGIKYDKAGLITGQHHVMQPFERNGREIVYLELKRLGEDEAEGDSLLAHVTARQDLL